MEKKLILRILSVASALVGVGILIYILAPIVGYKRQALSDASSYLSPIPRRDEKVVRSSDFQNPLDFTDARNWFVDTQSGFQVANIGHYRISIPTLGIEDAVVAIGGQDLSENLIQYPGTALPGKAGNAVIFGHSILPQFFDPKDYIAIFSTLPTLGEGDEVQVEYDGVTYRYMVEDMFEVLPTDIQILEQNSSDSFLTLVTCTPPGHPLRPKRLIVRARVVNKTAEVR